MQTRHYNASLSDNLSRTQCGFYFVSVSRLISRMILSLMVSLQQAICSGVSMCCLVEKGIDLNADLHGQSLSVYLYGDFHNRSSIQIFLVWMGAVGNSNAAPWTQKCPTEITSIGHWHNYSFVCLGNKKLRYHRRIVVLYSFFSFIGFESIKNMTILFLFVVNLESGLFFHSYSINFPFTIKPYQFHWYIRNGIISLYLKLISSVNFVLSLYIIKAPFQNHVVNVFE